MVKVVRCRLLLGEWRATKSPCSDVVTMAKDCLGEELVGAGSSGCERENGVRRDKKG